MLYRPCTLCKKNKGIEEFYKHPLGVHGVRPRCKVCVNAYRQRPEVKAKNAQYMRRRRATV